MYGGGCACPMVRFKVLVFLSDDSFRLLFAGRRGDTYYPPDYFGTRTEAKTTAFDIIDGFSGKKPTAVTPVTEVTPKPG